MSVSRAPWHLVIVRGFYLGIVLYCVATRVPSAEDHAPLYREQYRSQYHFSPPRHWMNDPNGMAYLDGKYHLFYQYNPLSSVWGPMHWGHAVSADLVHWTNLPIALAPDALGMIFSGSAVVDRLNTSGLGTPGNPPLVAIYTSHDMSAMQSGGSTYENQSIATSLDGGRTWGKYSGNPVLRSPGVKDFRDPKVSWFEPTGKWIMVLAVGDHVSIYSSPDLIHWVHESDFGREWGAHRGVWECPDLFPLVVEGEATRKFVLLVNINGGAPNSGSGTQYFVGDFDGHRFSPDTAQTADASWIDYGTDNFAGGTWSGLPQEDGRRVFLGWMSNWLYANVVPTRRWRGAMTLPRQLTLVRDAQRFELRSSPVAELARLRSTAMPIPKLKGRGPFELARRATHGTFELQLELDLTDAKLVTLEFTNRKQQMVQFRINRLFQRYELDRSKSGNVEFNPDFAREQVAPMVTKGRTISLHIFVDSSSLEIFVNHGETVMTALAFPSVPFDTATLKADEPVLLASGTAYNLRSIWTGAKSTQPNAIAHSGSFPTTPISSAAGERLR